MRPPVQKGQVVCSAQSIVSRISIFSSWFFLWIHMSGQWIVGKGATKCLEIAIILRLVLSSLKFPSTVFSAHSPCSLMDDCSCSASLLKVEHPELNLRVWSEPVSPTDQPRDLPHTFLVFLSGLQRQDSGLSLLPVFQVFSEEQECPLSPVGGPWKPLCETYTAGLTLLHPWTSGQIHGGIWEDKWQSVARGLDSVSAPSASSPRPGVPRECPSVSHRLWFLFSADRNISHRSPSTTLHSDWVSNFCDKEVLKRSVKVLEIPQKGGKEVKN